MSSANLDLVRSLYAAWERGDFSSTEWVHPDIEYVFTDGPTPRSWKGLASFVEGFLDSIDVWEEWRVEAQEYRELDNERVLVFVNYTGRGKTSGLELAQLQAKAANLFHLRGGKVVRFVVYLDRERALAELGFPSTNDSPDS